VVTNKVRLDQLTGARDIAFKVEFLGIDMTTRNLFDSMQPTQYLQTSESIILRILKSVLRNRGAASFLALKPELES
jgi:hypothetical protein